MSTERNVELLRAVADRIELEPWLYSQGEWATQALDDPTLEGPIIIFDDIQRGWDGARFVDIDKGAECGTACCVAGWAVQLSGQDARLLDDCEVDKKGQELLGLSEPEAGNLFSGSPVFAIPEWDNLSHIHRAKMMAEKLRAIADGEPVVAS